MTMQGDLLSKAGHAILRRSPSARGRRRTRRFHVEALEQKQLLAGDLAISEIHYNPAQGNDYEFIEFQNIGDASLSLNGVTFSSGITYTFGDVALAPDEIGVVVRDADAFGDLYSVPDVRVLGEFESGGLSNSGERLRLVDADGVELLDLEYGDSALWPFQADGLGASLELIDPSGTDPTLYSKSYSWRGSTEANGSPGRLGAGPVGVVVNEVLTHTDAPITPPDSIELLNVTPDPIDIGGWYLGDTADDRLKFQIPAGTVIGGGEVILYDETDFNPTPDDPGPNDFRLDAALGDYVWLTESVNGTDIDRFIDAVQFGAALNSESFGRHPDGTGVLTPMSRLSLGCENPYPRVGPVVISEVQYNPPEPSAAAMNEDPLLESDDLEFIEIHNPTGQAVDLTEWRIRGGVDLDFDDGSILDSFATWIVLSFNPENPDNASRLNGFIAHYGLSGAETFVGGYSGSLGNSEDRVQLQFPDDPPTNGPDVIPRLHHDEVRYDDQSPWPTSADGGGSSLQRRAPVFYGNDVDSWISQAPTPGNVDFTGNVDGDYNNDGLTDAKDIDILVTAASMSSAALYMDLDGSFSVTQGDVTVYLQTVIGVGYGDANLDGVVDASDFNIWNDNKFESCNKSWSDGDWNGDAAVDAADLNVWSINKFKSSSPLAPLSRARLPRAAASNSDLATNDASRSNRPIEPTSQSGWSSVPPTPTLSRSITRETRWNDTVESPLDGGWRLASDEPFQPSVGPIPQMVASNVDRAFASLEHRAWTSNRHPVSRRAMVHDEGSSANRAGRRWLPRECRTVDVVETVGQFREGSGVGPVADLLVHAREITIGDRQDIGLE